MGSMLERLQYEDRVSENIGYLSTEVLTLSTP